MRQFKIWNHDRTEAFDFKTHGCLITEVSGLGIKFSTALANGVVVDFRKEFEDITLMANFGIKANAYTAFTNFATFISANGKNKLVLEYSVNGRTLFADVWINRIPKTQKTNFNILTETIVFTRLSYWYTLVTGTIPTTPASIQIDNTFFEQILVDVEIKASTPADFKITTKNAQGTVVSEIIIPSQLIAGTLTLFAEDKIVDRFTAGSHSNGYNLVSRAGDTFLVIDKGLHYINTNASVTNQPVVTYKKWVID